MGKEWHICKKDLSDLFLAVKAVRFVAEDDICHWTELGDGKLSTVSLNSLGIKSGSRIKIVRFDTVAHYFTGPAEPGNKQQKSRVSCLIVSGSNDSQFAVIRSWPRLGDKNKKYGLDVLQRDDHVSAGYILERIDGRNPPPCAPAFFKQLVELLERGESLPKDFPF